MEGFQKKTAAARKKRHSIKKKLADLFGIILTRLTDPYDSKGQALGCLLYVLIITIYSGLFFLFWKLLRQLHVPRWFEDHADTVFAFIIAGILTFIFTRLEDRSKRKKEERELALRKVPKELDDEFEKVVMDMYEMAYILNKAEERYKQYTVSDIRRWLKNGEVTDGTARKLLINLNECEEIIEEYPSKIEAAARRKKEILKTVEENWPNEIFPRKTIYIPKDWVK